jgi:hypothetical protein
LQPHQSAKLRRRSAKRQRELLEQIEKAGGALATANFEKEAATTAFDPKSNEFDDNAKRLWLAEQCVKAHERQLGELTAQSKPSSAQFL